MKFGELVAGLPAKKAAAYTFDRGKVTKHSYAALAGDVARAERTLRGWGLKAGSRIGIFAPNSYEWIVYDLAIIALGAVSVPFTDDFIGKIDRALLDKYEISLLLIAKSNAKYFPDHAAYVAFLDAENGVVAPIPRENISDPDDLTMVFSSGSAGGLKGLSVSRSGVESTLPPIMDAFGLGQDDRMQLFLPMSNFQQRNMYYSSIWYDYDILITDYLQLPASIKCLQPTALIAPPIYFQGFYTRYNNFSAAKKMLWRTVGTLLSLLPGAGLRTWLAQKMFGEFYNQFGGKMRRLITGMAPSKGDVAGFFDLMQLPLCESYGMMESGSITYRPPGSRNYNSVGKVLPGITIHFGDDGEVIVEREHALTRRYFQCAEGENERTFLGNNRIATGDIGRLDEEGFLYLLGRKKELIVTPAGYKLHPETLERELAGCHDIAQVAVFLKKDSAMLVCVVVLAGPDSPEARARVKAFVRELKGAKSSPISEIIFTDAPFSTENGMLRPNLKLDRRGIAVQYNI